MESTMVMAMETTAAPAVVLPWCHDEVMYANDYVINPFRIIATVGVLIAMYKHYKAYKADRLTWHKDSKLSFFLVMLFFLVCACALYFHFLFLVTVCDVGFLPATAIHFVFNYGSSLSGPCAITFLYWRLYNDFKHTPSAVSKAFKYFALLCVVFMMANAVSGAVLTTMTGHAAWSVKLAVRGYIATYFFSFFLVAMYVWKFYQLLPLYRNMGEKLKKEEYPNAINMLFAQKMVTMWVVEIIMSGILLILVFGATNVETQGKRVAINAITPITIVLRFATVFLAYKEHEGIYFATYGWIHKLFCCGKDAREKIIDADIRFMNPELNQVISASTVQENEMAQMDIEAQSSENVRSVGGIPIQTSA